MNRYRLYAWSLLASGLFTPACFAETTTAATPAEPAADVPGRLHTVALPPIPLQRAYDWAKKIDAHITNRLKQEGIAVSPQADDAEFLRRASIDIIGRIPSANTVRAFLDNPDPDKRRKAIETLLADPGYGRQQADRWTTQLLPRESNNRRLAREPLEKFLTERFNRNQPWNLLVTDLLTASGLQDDNGAVTFFAANPTPDKVTDTVCRLFLGVQLQCAQCHNHPFTGWKQNEYWAMASFFMKVQLQGGKKPGRNGPPGISESVRVNRARKGLPEATKFLPPKFLQGIEPKVKESDPLRPVFAEWLTASDNPFFAHAMVNRTWASFFGRGLVNPVDDMHADNKATHPELLNELSREFAASGFDLKHLIRAIVNSETYQRSSRPTAGNESDQTLYSHMPVRVLSPEQLYDSLVSLTGTDTARPAKGKNNEKRPPATPRAQFVTFFTVSEEPDPTRYEQGIPQALRLMNSGSRRFESTARSLARSATSSNEIVEQLFLTTLSRRPTTVELRKLSAHISESSDRVDAVNDLLWALLNSSEFCLNH